MDKLKGFLSSSEKIVNALALPDDELAITQKLIETAAGCAKRLGEQSNSSLCETLETIVARMVVHQESVDVQLDRLKLRAQFLGPDHTDPQTQNATNDLDHEPITLTIKTKLKRCGMEMRLIIPPQSANQTPGNAVPALIKAISRAHEWVRLIVADKYKDQRAISKAAGLTERYVSRIIQCAFLAPEIVEGIINGQQAPELTLVTLVDKVPLSWANQNAKIHAVC